MSRYGEAIQLMIERFGRDTLISLATMEGNRPSVRVVNSYYEAGSFYVVTYARSNKMRQISGNAEVAICGEWFAAHGIGENMGHVLDERNIALMAKLRVAFAEWYGNGHVREDDPNTCVLRVRLTDGALFHRGAKYEIDFVEKTAL